ncbi:MAG: hypothetical protein GC160_09740 [Acidobacteria bacterium]|nr:hypothetical protein [Acidobacteriota bacterium]
MLVRNAVALCLISLSSLAGQDVEYVVAQTHARHDPGLDVEIVETIHLAHWANGTEAETRARFGRYGEHSASGVNRTIWDAVAGRRILLSPTTKSKATQPLTPAALKRRTAKTGLWCTDLASPEEFVDTQAGAILGYSVVQRTRSGPEKDGRSRRVERWLAPELGCLELRRTDTVIQSGAPDVVVESIETLSVEPGTPEGRWADRGVPVGYTERTVAEITALEARAAGR